MGSPSFGLLCFLVLVSNFVKWYLYNYHLYHEIISTCPNSIYLLNIFFKWIIQGLTRILREKPLFLLNEFLRKMYFETW